MSDRTDRIKQLAETGSERLWAFVIGLPAPGTAIVTLVIFFLIGLGVRSLL